MITSQRMKIKTNGDTYRNFITYFQSVTTLGIVNRARTPQEAEKQAKFKMRDQSFMCGVLGHTPYELHATEEWQSHKSDIDENLVSLSKSRITNENENENENNPLSETDKILGFLLEGNTKECIADKFCKDPKTMTNEDYIKLIKTMIEMGLE